MELGQGCYRIDGIRHSSAYLLSGEGRWVVVDTGMKGHAKAILSFAQQLGLGLSGLKAILLTHRHMDHAGSVAPLLAQVPAAALYVHPADAPFVASGQVGPQQGWMAALFRIFGTFTRIPPVEESRPLQDGQILELAGWTLRVLHVPGHTAGSVAFLVTQLGALISGDAIVTRRGRAAPPPAPFTDDMDQARESLSRLTALSFEQLWPGHGDPIRSEAQKAVRALVDGFTAA
ncbi:MAG: MBL fold metallo-hydrolase [Firmicutes bacterium]|nr:MBL fold metallo-hydrolase [Bacillota bacterium]